MKSTYENFQFHIVDNRDFTEIMKEHESKFYEEVHGLNFAKIFTEDEKVALRKLNKEYSDNLTLCIKITNNEGAFVGWCYGDQYDRLTFTMHSSFIHPDFRRKGIYAYLLDFVIEWSQQKGFVKVISNHSTTNNAIIIPKLKKGFVIAGLNMDDRFGMTVNLSYYINKNLETANKYRANSKLENSKVLESFD
jgi:GNAT superfamily N-acetyltransferase